MGVLSLFQGFDGIEFSLLVISLHVELRLGLGQVVALKGLWDLWELLDGSALLGLTRTLELIHLSKYVLTESKRVFVSCVEHIPCGPSRQACPTSSSSLALTRRRSYQAS